MSQHAANEGHSAALAVLSLAARHRGQYLTIYSLHGDTMSVRARRRWPIPGSLCVLELHSRPAPGRQARTRSRDATGIWYFLESAQRRNRQAAVPIRCVRKTLSRKENSGVFQSSSILSADETRKPPSTGLAASTVAEYGQPASISRLGIVGRPGAGTGLIRFRTDVVLVASGFLVISFATSQGRLFKCRRIERPTHLV